MNGEFWPANGNAKVSPNGGYLQHCEIGPPASTRHYSQTQVKDPNAGLSAAAHVCSSN